MPADAPAGRSRRPRRTPVAIEDVGGEQSLLDGEPMLGDRYASYLGRPAASAPRAISRACSRSTGGGRAPGRRRRSRRCGALAANASVAFSKAELYQQVELERERSVAILANVADGIVAVDREEQIVLWNAAAERITAVPSEEALGRTVPEVLQRELRSESGDRTGDRLVPIRRGDEEVWLSLTEAVMRDPLGETAGRIFAFRDISGERAVEQMRSDFVSTVSHELRAPLTSIYGFAATLLREDVQFEEEERRTFLSYIESEAGRLTTIVDKLLSVARLDAGDLQLEISPGRRALARLRGRRRPRARRSSTGTSSSSTCPRSPLAAHTDADKLRQVLASLVDNAVRFSPDGGRVTVGAARRGETIVLSVVDQGIGIPDAEQERIFSKFYRVGDAQTGGTGVGLFIAQGLVSVLGGRITVHSQEGRGSSFVVELPARDDSARGWVDEHGAPRVLIVDDEAPIRLLCRVNLEAEGMAVLEAADGPAGLETARRERPDVVLLDVMMPGLDGWRVAEQLLDDPETRSDPDHLPDRSRGAPRPRPRDSISAAWTTSRSRSTRSSSPR